MKVHLSEIPEEGLKRRLELPLGRLRRLTEVCGEQAGTLVAELRIRNREGNLEITGQLRAEVQAPCQRCLEAVPLQFDERVRVALAPGTAYEEAPDDVHLGAGDLEVSFYEGEEIDLAHLLEDELLLLLPEAVAEEDEDGRCVICGRTLEDLYAQPEDEGGHPFAQLKHLMERDG